MPKLIKINAHGKPTYAQAAFNKLVAQVDKKQKELLRCRAKVELGKMLYAEKIVPLQAEYAQLQKAYALALYHWAEHPKLSSGERQKLAQVLGYAIGQALAFAPHDPEMADLRAKTKLLGNEAKSLDEPCRERPNTKKAMVTSAEAAAPPDLKKMAKQLFNDLAKQLHPDLEHDERARTEKTELMKLVTKAYGQHDIFGLLHLHQAHMDDERQLPLEQMDDGKTQSYVNLLKKQAASVQRQIDDLKTDLSTRFLYHLMSGSETEQQRKLQAALLHLSERNERVRRAIESAHLDAKSFTRHLKSIDLDGLE